MKTIEELANLGARAALESLVDGTESMAIGKEVLPECWEDDKPAREAFARAVRDAVLAAADVPTWRPIAELPDDEQEYTYWNGEMSWHGNPQEKDDATHFISPPPKPDPFEAWWKEQAIGDKAIARIIWNAAREAKSKKSLTSLGFESLVNLPEFVRKEQGPALFKAFTEKLLK